MLFRPFLQRWNLRSRDWLSRSWACVLRNEPVLQRIIVHRGNLHEWSDVSLFWPSMQLDQPLLLNSFLQWWRVHDGVDVCGAWAKLRVGAMLRNHNMFRQHMRKSAELLVELYVQHEQTLWTKVHLPGWRKYWCRVLRS
jgi:hypothetical protein